MGEFRPSGPGEQGQTVSAEAMEQADARRRAQALLALAGTRMYDGSAIMGTLWAALVATKELCHDYNLLRPSQEVEQRELLTSIFAHVGENVTMLAPMWCDYGVNTTIGANCYFNHGQTILDGAPVAFGDNVFVGPQCVFATAVHPIDAQERNRFWEYAEPITVESDVWIGAHVTVLSGVRIGRGTVIGAGSVVNRDIPAGVVAVGNPCRVLREVSEADRNSREFVDWVQVLS